MYTLVVTEKPSVAMSIAAVLDVKSRKDGYMEGGSWLISWCVGHLAGLANADTYDPKYAKWRREDLPILPDSWRFTIGKDKQGVALIPTSQSALDRHRAAWCRPS